VIITGCLPVKSRRFVISLFKIFIVVCVSVHSSVGRRLEPW